MDGKLSPRMEELPTAPPIPQPRLKAMEEEIDREMPFYRIRNSFHLGDRWSRINFALRLIEQRHRMGIYLPDQLCKDIVDALDIGDLQPHLTDVKDRTREMRGLNWYIDQGTRAYSCQYFPTRKRHSPEARKIGYSFSANWRAELKIPRHPDKLLNTLRQRFQGFDFVPLGLPHQTTIGELVDVLASVRLFLSVDSGVAHVARSVGTPLFLLEYKWGVERGFPSAACHYTKVTRSDAGDHLERFLLGEKTTA